MKEMKLEAKKISETTLVISYHARPVCEDCDYWHDNRTEKGKAEANRNDKSGYCRESPPYQGVETPTPCDYWCGKHTGWKAWKALSESKEVIERVKKRCQPIEANGMIKD